MVWLVRTFVLVLALAIAGPPAAAQAEREQKVEIISSVWCDTPDQLETVLRAHYGAKVPLGQAMAAINRNSPDACIVARAIVNIGAEVRRVTAGDIVMSVRSARVHGIMRGEMAMMMQPQTWFYVRIIAELVPL